MNNNFYETASKRRFPGKGFAKNFFKVHGPVRTIKGGYFYYYTQMRLRKLHLDPSITHTVHVNGHDLDIIPDDKGISAELFLYNSHEPLTTKVLSSNLRDGMVCLDIGSNIGYYALLESGYVGKNGLVICVEPSPVNFDYLKTNMQKRARSPYQLYNIALGKRDGSVSFMTRNESNLSRVVENHQDAYFKDNHKVIKVPLKSVDSLVRELEVDRLDLVRMDPEGYEANIFQGMKTAVSRFKPILLIEFHRNYLGLEGTRNLLEDILRSGYECRSYIPRWMDNPLIANDKYIQQMSVSQLLKKVDKDSLPAVFTLFLTDNCK